ncbi:MAG TPA: hypothetical protein VG245_04400 [Candidatus Dormibacteraeota bacterium]|jgi:hypothetical protein|nr:hypothetical protein [Candidatus Dormibacteraeota bacterium]
MSDRVVRKLGLSRETVRDLSDGRLAGAAGGLATLIVAGEGNLCVSLLCILSQAGTCILTQAKCPPLT